MSYNSRELIITDWWELPRGMSGRLNYRLLLPSELKELIRLTPATKIKVLVEDYLISLVLKWLIGKELDSKGVEVKLITSSEPKLIPDRRRKLIGIYQDEYTLNDDAPRVGMREEEMIEANLKLIRDMSLHAFSKALLSEVKSQRSGAQRIILMFLLIEERARGSN